MVRHEVRFVHSLAGPQTGADTSDREQAAEAMGAISDPSSLPVLCPYLTHPDRAIRETCEIAVAKIEWDNSPEGKAANVPKCVFTNPKQSEMSQGANSPLPVRSQRSTRPQPRRTRPLLPRRRRSRTSRSPSSRRPCSTRSSPSLTATAPCSRSVTMAARRPSSHSHRASRTTVHSSGAFPRCRLPSPPFAHFCSSGLLLTTFD